MDSESGDLLQFIDEDDYKAFKKSYFESSNKKKFDLSGYMNQYGGIAKPPKEYDGVFDEFEELVLSKQEEVLQNLLSYLLLMDMNTGRLLRMIILKSRLQANYLIK